MYKLYLFIYFTSVKAVIQILQRKFLMVFSHLVFLSLRADRNPLDTKLCFVQRLYEVLLFSLFTAVCFIHYWYFGSGTNKELTV